MIDDRLSQAIARLERAVTHLEARLPPVPVPVPSGDADPAIRERYERLEARHDALRTRTSDAIERLTRLLEPAKED